MRPGLDRPVFKKNRHGDRLSLEKCCEENDAGGFLGRVCIQCLPAFSGGPMKRAALLILCLFSACVGRSEKDENEGIDFGTALTVAAAPAFFAQTPADNFFSVRESSMEVPQRIHGAYVPVGKIYDIELNHELIARNVELSGKSFEIPPGQIVFSPQKPARIVYQYDRDALRDAGLMEEFAVFFFNTQTGQWEPVDGVETSDGTVTAYTTHLTPFVLTAIAAPSGPTTPAPPACLAADYPSGIGGNSGASFQTVGSNFKYYRDRDYYIIPSADFLSLGFEQAVGISTCNGNSFCGTFAQHKNYAGTAYIEFTAHTDLDLYLMYDTRGGANLADNSNDAQWILSDPDFINTGKYIQTTDAVTNYRVYKKSYSKGQPVILHGNNRDVGSGAINTNYWVVLKRRGDTSSQPSGYFCEAQPDHNPIVPVSGLLGVPGRFVSLLLWDNPDRPDFQGVVVRRSTIGPPAHPGEGNAPGGSSPHSQAFDDSGLANNTTYFYTVFSVYGGDVFPARSVAVRTGPDPDGDGISSAYENLAVYAGGQTAANDRDTDNDGLEDRAELIAGTDPTNGDIAAPVLSDFSRTSVSPTEYPLVSFSLDSADSDVTGWFVTTSDTPPRASDSGWQAVKPAAYPLAGKGTYILYAYARDAAGNVSAARTLSVDLVGVRVTDGLVAASTDGSAARQIEQYVQDLFTGLLSFRNAAVSQPEPVDVAVHPAGHFVYTLVNTDPAGPQAGNSILAAHRLDPTGMLPVGQVIAAARYDSIHIHPGGSFLYALRGNPGALDVYRIDASGAVQFVSRQITEPYAGNVVLYQPGSLIFLPNHRDARIGFSIPGWAASFEFGCDFGIEFNLSTGAVARRIDPVGGCAMDAVNSRAILKGGAITIALHKTRASAYIKSRNGGGMAAADVPLPAGKSVVGHPFLSRFYYLNPDGTAIVVGTPVESVYGYVTTATTTTLAVPGTVSSLRMDPGGRHLYAYRRGSGQLHVFAVSQLDGSLAHTQTLSLSANAASVALRTRVDGNDPPAVRLRRQFDSMGVAWIDFAAYGAWVPAGRSLTLYATDSFDPDAARCGADPSRYVYQWRLVDKPAASMLPLNSTALSGSSTMQAGIVPDVTGEYTIQFAFTDDPGSCSQASQTTTDTIRIHARRFVGASTSQDVSCARCVNTSRLPAQSVAYHVSASQEIGKFTLWWCVVPPFVPNGWGCAPRCIREGWERGAAIESCYTEVYPLAGIDQWDHWTYRVFVDYYWYED